MKITVFYKEIVLILARRSRAWSCPKYRRAVVPSWLSYTRPLWTQAS